MQSTTQYIMKDQVQDLVPSIMNAGPAVQAGAFSLLRVVAFLGATATYLAALALSA